jgi:hypothetical protein
MMLVCLTFFSCSEDEKIIQTPVSEENLNAAKKVLNDSIILNARGMMGTVNKTLLEEGCPLKYYFSWKGDSLNIQIRKFSVGRMPVTIYFGINCAFMQLNTWEKDEYKGKGWIKFEGIGGVTNYTGNDQDTSHEYTDGGGGGGTVTGYFNADTNEIEFETEFNVMDFSADVYQQKIDKSRMANYAKEFTQYEADLAAYKKAHGL